MKKISLILVMVIVLASLLIATAPVKLVRMSIINKSSHVIYMKLQGQTFDQFYYLTVPEGSRLAPVYETYTLVKDAYSRVTTYGPGSLGCDGLSNSGSLLALKQFRLVFTPCGQFLNGQGEPRMEKVTYFENTEFDYGNGRGGCYYDVWVQGRYSPLGGCRFFYKY